MNTVTLQDPQTGALLHLRRAELEQSCAWCGMQLQGEWIVSVEGGTWTHLDHVERVLMTQPPSAAFTARKQAQRALADALPGDQVTVTASMLVAVGLDR